MLGSLMCEGMGPICLGSKSVTLKKQKQKGNRSEKKNREKRRERKKRICPDFINKPTHFICGPIELKFGGEV